MKLSLHETTEELVMTKDSLEEEQQQNRQY